MGVRLEKVILDLEDRLTGKLGAPILAVMELDRALDKLDGSTARVAVRSSNVEREIDRIGTSARKNGPDIDRLSGRLRIAADVAALLGPAVVSVGALGLPAIAGLTAMVGTAAVAGISAIAAFQGVGTAVEAVAAYDLEPTAANLEAAQAALAQLGPDARAFVGAWREFQPTLDGLRDAAAAGWFPGLTESLDDLEKVGPQFERILEAVGRAGGDAVAADTESLASDRWAPFLKFIEAEAPVALTKLNGIVGSLGHAFASMVMELDPGADDFLDWAGDLADDLDRWSTSTKGREDLAAFLDYARENGPEVAEAVGSIADTVAQVVQAAAPLGGPALKGLTLFSDLVGGIADSDLGTPILTAVAALAAYNRTMAITRSLSAAGGAGGGPMAFLGGFTESRSKGIRSSLAAVRADVESIGSVWGTAGARTEREQARMTAATKSLRTNLGGVAKEAARAGAPVAGLALLSTGAADKIGLTNTASLALMGTMAGPWGTALGAAAGAVLDIAASNDTWDASIKSVRSSLLESAPVMEQMRAELAKQQDFDTSNPFERLSDPKRLLTGAFDDAKYALLGGESETDKMADDLAALQRQIVATKGLAGGLEGAFTVGDSTEDRLRGVGAAMGALRNDALPAAEAASLLESALSGLLSPTLDAEAATDQWRASLRALRSELDASAGFKGQSEAAAANRAQSRDYTAAVQQRLVAMAKSNASEEDMAKAVRQSRREFIASGVAAGISATAMRRRANEMGLTPKMVRTVFQALGIKQIDLDVRAMRKQVQQLPKNVRTNIAANGIPKTVGEVNALVKRYGLTEKQRTALLTLRDMASNNVRAAQRLLDALGRSRPNPTVTLNDRASGVAGYIQSAIDAIQGKTVTITTVHRDVRQGVSAAKSAQGLSNADGGLYDNGVWRYADGGIHDSYRRALGPADTHVTRHFAEGGLGQDGRYYPRESQIVRGGANIMWAEEETGWEAYISGKPSMLERNRDILAEAADRLGMAVVGYADGGVAERRRDGDGGGRGRRGGRGGDGDADRSARSLARALREAERSVRAEKAARDKVTDKMNQAGDGARTGLRSDLFEDRGVWAASSGSGATLTADNARIREFIQLTQALSKKGLDREALAELTSRGDVDVLRRYNGQSPAALRQYEQDFNTRERLLAQASKVVGSTAYGADFSVANRELAQANKKLDRIQAAVKEADRGNRKGHEGSGQRTAQALDHTASQGKHKGRFNGKGGKR